MKKSELEERKQLVQRFDLGDRDVQKLNDLEVVKYCLTKIQDTALLMDPNDQVMSALLSYSIIAWRAVKNMNSQPIQKEEKKMKKARPRRVHKKDEAKKEPGTEQS